MTAGPPVSAVRGEQQGLCIRKDEALGNVLVATRRFSRGEMVLCEKPLVVVSSPWGLKEALNESDEYTRDAVMGMCFNPVIGKAKKELKRDANSVFTLGAILSSNGQAYNPPRASGAVGAADDDKGDSDGPELVALYHMGSKAQHSCFPNCAYRNVAGRLVFTALVDIEAETVIAFSYCLDWRELQLPTFLRRALVTERRCFDCLCERCVASEDCCRRLRCGACGSSGSLNVDEPQRETSTWSCSSCSARFAAAAGSAGDGDGGGGAAAAAAAFFADAERELSAAAAALRLVVADKGDAPAGDGAAAMAELRTLREACAAQLGIGHWSTAKCNYLWALRSTDAGNTKEAEEAYDAFRAFLRASGLDLRVPTVYHVLTNHLLEAGAFSDDRAIQLCKEVLPLYQAIHGPGDVVDGMRERLGGAEEAERLCSESGIAARW
eukprot:TRINITY_DN8118_c0_g1_i1.p1 TRINITY_DN8118_c0_g1~~TRINITY_DN8118_c0_g1_i1.p1  ORF type:complete len:438 (+),score=123.43 TRINITY_DN8118_c0_g1_i1:190-1503(+)